MNIQTNQTTFLTKEQQLQSKGNGISYFWLCIAFIYLMYCILMVVVGTEQGMGILELCIAMIPMLALLVVWPAVFAIKRIGYIKTFNKYVVSLRENADSSLTYVSDVTGDSLDVVKKNCEIFLKKKWFKNATINYADNVIVFDYSLSASKKPGIGQSDIKLVSIICPGCGATNSVAHGVVAECEYCGAKING